ncbi:MAG: exodeoxyribonuclease VII small subunit [Clostridia bacterium]|nr:exodeoxyribonuclease VII small subunit [Clostridia bacterium]
MSYEEAVKELENILEALEQGEISLDEAIKLFEKSVELSKTCFEKIKTTEGKVEIIKKELEQITIKPFTDIENN